MLNPVLPAPRSRRIQTARNAVDVILNARSAADLRLYGWEKGQATADGRFRWKGTEEHKGQYRTQKTEPGTGRGKKAQGDATAGAAEGKQPAAKHPAQKKQAAPRKPKVDHNEVGDRIEKMLGTDFADQDVGALREELLSLTGAQLDEVKKRFAVRGGKSKADVAGRIAGHVGGSRKKAGQPAEEAAKELPANAYNYGMHGVQEVTPETMPQHIERARSIAKMLGHNVYALKTGGMTAGLNPTSVRRSMDIADGINKAVSAAGGTPVGFNREHVEKELQAIEQGYQSSSSPPMAGYIPSTRGEGQGRILPRVTPPAPEAAPEKPARKPRAVKQPVRQPEPVPEPEPESMDLMDDSDSMDMAGDDGSMDLADESPAPAPAPAGRQAGTLDDAHAQRQAEPVPSPSQKQAASRAIFEAVGDEPVVDISELRSKMPRHLQGRAFDDAVIDLLDSREAMASQDSDPMNAKPGHIRDGGSVLSTLTLDRQSQRQTPPPAAAPTPAPTPAPAPQEEPPRTPNAVTRNRLTAGVKPSALPAGKPQAKRTGRGILNARNPVDVVLYARSPQQARPLLYAWLRTASKRNPGKTVWVNSNNPKDRRYQEAMPKQRATQSVESLPPQEHLQQILEAPYRVADYYLTSLQARLRRMRPGALAALRMQFNTEG